MAGNPPHAPRSLLRASEQLKPSASLQLQQALRGSVRLGGLEPRQARAPARGSARVSVAKRGYYVD